MYSSPLVAVVEIGGRAAAIVGAVFLGTFAIVCVVGWSFLRSGSSGPRGTKTWSLDLTRQITVSKPTFDRVASFTQKALSRPTLTPEKRAALDRLGEVRDVLGGFLRTVMIVAGLVGIAGAVALGRQADDGNMLLLPAGIVLLFSLGAILQGLVPSWRTGSSEPLDTSLFDEIDIQVSQNPITINLDETNLSKATEMLRDGASPDEVARAIHPGYDELDDFEKTLVKESLARALAHVLKS
jgi:hypothetical protein